MTMINSLWKTLTRRKTFSTDDDESKLARVLTLFDLTALGVGSTLGLGVYVLAGSVAYDIAGPAVVISFLIAAIASTFAALCYAELAARVPKAGSAYIYSYVTIGEFVAFTIGWTMLLEYAIGAASVASGMTGYIDELIGRKIATFLRELIPINSDFLGKYPDIVSFLIIILITLLLIAGVRESSIINNIFTTVNMCTVLTVLIAGAIKSVPTNWTIKKEDIPDTYKELAGEGGFMPYGWAGIMAGAARCFYGFIGFDCIATTGEEAQRPERNIPLSIVISLIIIFLAYFGVSTVLTMMWPYYLQNPAAPFPHAFGEIGWIEIKWVVTIGALFALTNSLYGSLFPNPRVVYSMANDGVVFKYFSKVHLRTQTPIPATIFCGLFAATMALFFNLDQLIDMMSIGTLLAYTIVAASVLILRYRDPNGTNNELDIGCLGVLAQLINFNLIKTPNGLTSRISEILIIIFIFLSIMFCLFLNLIETYSTLNITFISLIVTALLLCTLIIGRQPVYNIKLTFKVPFVPVIPCLSILMNLYLMFQLETNTWLRLCIWFVLGYTIYFLYGIRYSAEGQKIKDNNLKQQII